jgi:hypothetical protein
MGKIPVIPDKFTEKTIRELAATTTVCWTGCSVPLKYGSIMLGEITLHIPVIFPDMVNILASLKQSRGIFKDGNCSHLSRILNKDFNKILVC